MAGTWNWSWSSTTDVCCNGGGTVVETGFVGLLIRKAVAGTAVVASSGRWGCCSCRTCCCCCSDRPSWSDGTWSPPIPTCSTHRNVEMHIIILVFTFFKRYIASFLYISLINSRPLSVMLLHARLSFLEFFLSVGIVGENGTHLSTIEKKPAGSFLLSRWVDGF